MNLKQLSDVSARVLGSPLGFTIKSLAHPERKFKVEAKVSGEKFVLTRLDSGKSYIVMGSEDRYDFSMNINRVGELKAELVELQEQAGTISERIGIVKSELGDFVGVMN